MVTSVEKIMGWGTFKFEWVKEQFSEFVWSIVAKRLHLDLTLKHIDKDLEAGMFGS